MKKFSLIALALMASASSSFAQTVLWDGEDKELGTSYTGVWDRCNPEVVENPTKDNVNSSDKCLKITITGTDWDNGDTAFGLSGSSFSSKRLSLKIKKDESSNVRVDLTYKVGDNNEYKKVVAWYDGNGEWRTLYFDFSTNGDFDNPTEIAIYPTTDPFDGSKVVYIDDVQIEDLPKVGETILTDIEDASLTGNVKLYGTWLKGECQNADGDWKKVEFNDFATFNAKSSDALTSVDMRGTVTKDVDVAAMLGDRPNTLLYADEAYDRFNVVAEQDFKNASDEDAHGLYAAKGVELNSAYAFSCPEAFTAANVKLTRTVREGINSFVLPFYVGASDLDAEAVATYKEVADDNAVFAKADHAEANVPFITVALTDAAESKEFTFSGNQKYFEATPASFDGNFKGVYAPQSANGLYGIDNNGLLHKGGEAATIKAFHAYYQVAEGENAPEKISFAGEDPTGIKTLTTTDTVNEAVYDLGGRRVAAKLNGANLVKGVYVVGGKKVVVK